MRRGVQTPSGTSALRRAAYRSICEKRLYFEKPPNPYDLSCRNKRTPPRAAKNGVKTVNGGAPPSLFASFRDLYPAQKTFIGALRDKKYVFFDRGIRKLFGADKRQYVFCAAGGKTDFSDTAAFQTPRSICVIFRAQNKKSRCLHVFIPAGHSKDLIFDTEAENSLNSDISGPLQTA